MIWFLSELVICRVSHKNITVYLPFISTRYKNCVQNVIVPTQFALKKDDHAFRLVGCSCFKVDLNG